MRPVRAWVIAAILLSANAAADALRGPVPINKVPEAPAMPQVDDRDQRKVRNYPEQPPVIPHDIRGYQIDLRFNRCLTCHSREAAPAAGAPMVSVTHFMDRDQQMLTEVSGRRYFCTQCHVPQMVVEPVISNTFGEK